MKQPPVKEIQNRNDIAQLVAAFYARVREHEHLGPIFNKVITDWPAHLEILTTFWESQLFLNRSYMGNPIKKHQDTDKAVNHSITMEHFGQWLELWIATIDEHFTGERAWIAQNRARKMATMFFLEIYKARQ
ncbi:group III truncated hemoglobin [Robertkochia sediminum]|uniref:group III truncated hemoglobin n=1 Tax=Robertkochia sediminum TaxID=2785326 RepID=UPI0019331992|nr:group III truncated hemoglobin [Robertkochia sediminum]MBL7471277.1 group III truncated hemoglobin [Robertkochia sediminum]